ncbi:PadR family transcriptional regulator [Solirubrobacter phytolaccae]|uniref:PadR family transcriptional regulator n=1 Tax=Solirubrobacter phytolaccae TaxID=1404360 RepID=A0A9X3S6J1_9ACTN|nr:PadR family transcriptional regulator [Solirubrobacter phytolaccae]MDA0180004.1 PadR family transcriptional regulator [Solirubrobacter phytolaccae]
MAPAISQLRRGVLEYCVLALLRDGERYAYELVTTLGEADGMVTSEGTLYPLLSRLRKEGLVETTWRESTSGPPRRYYTLTAEGEATLDAFVVEWRRFSRSVDGLLAMGNPHDAHPAPARRGLLGAARPGGRPPAARPAT